MEIVTTIYILETIATGSKELEEEALHWNSGGWKCIESYQPTGRPIDRLTDRGRIVMLEGLVTARGLVCSGESVGMLETEWFWKA